MLGSEDESRTGQYYTQLGAASSVDGVRQLMETRSVSDEFNSNITLW